MDPRYSAQDILRCDLCEEDVVQNHCEVCFINLCEACKGKHLSSKRHKVVPYSERKTPNNPKCQKHSKNCQLFCDKCDMPVCSTCISSGKHKEHCLLNVFQKLSSKTKDIKKDLRELEFRIYPKYEEIAADIENKKDKLENLYQKLKTAVNKQGENWHREINLIVNKQNSEIDDMKTKHISVLDKQENIITQLTSKIKHRIFDLQKILESNDLSLAHKSRNDEFRRLPPDVNVSLPVFSPQKINTKRLRQLFGSLSELSMTTKHGNAMETPETVSNTQVRRLLDEPELITTINATNKIYNIACLSDEEIWTRGNNNILKLYNLQGKLVKSVQTISLNNPDDITVTKSEDLIYTDYKGRSINKVRKGYIVEWITLHGWKPSNVCGTLTDDLLVIMDSDDGEQSKLVRYTGQSEQETFKFDNTGKPLYSSGYFTKYISENRNLDICVADILARAVVVVNQIGNLRFRHTGHSPTAKRYFEPVGVTTDSQSQILTSDRFNSCIHILDRDGQFLSYIENCELYHPWGLCVNTKDHLFVAESDSERVKQIKYM
ncbi:E3 ubiquitin-protein ligase TRIM45-like [Saccostrea cucullata]|uniref:E3 ubiquitin-protein ligase TRIM45-like n=1 Tax=Saccostrea cuccullata TaxID=36930 RepID=UPI002ED5D16F